MAPLLKLVSRRREVNGSNDVREENAGKERETAVRAMDDSQRVCEVYAKEQPRQAGDSGKTGLEAVVVP